MTAKSRALTFSIVIAVFVTALAFVWQKFGTPTALAALGSLAIGSYLGFRRVQEDGENGEVLPFGRLTAALPKSWHKWMFDEGAPGPRKD